MPSDVFKVSDKRYLIAAYADNATHGRMGLFEAGLGFEARGNNKIERATSTINYLFQERNTDELIMDLLNFLFVENPTADVTPTNSSFEALHTHVLVPRGVDLTDDGFKVSLQPVRPVVEPSMPPLTEGTLRGMREGLRVFGAVLSDADTGSASAPVPPVTIPASKTVFVVHGRDIRPVEQIETFLLFLGLSMMSWSEAVRLTGQAQPHTYDIVKAGMDGAAAVVVIFSPDDEARVKRHFASAGETTEADGQARQNVLVEAGMAFAQSRTKTIFVQSERTRPITDLEGFNWVKLDGQWDSRQDFIHRLRSAGADPMPTYPQLDHRTAGQFKVTS